jgi:hypothetical protein
MLDVVTKGSIVSQAAYIAGVNGSITGVNGFDFKAMLQHLELLALSLEAQYGLYLGYKKALGMDARSDDDSGLNDTDAYALACILAYRAHAILGLDQITYERCRRVASELVGRLADINTGSIRANEQLPIGAGNAPFPNTYWVSPFQHPTEKISIDDDGELDLGDMVVRP